MEYNIYICVRRSGYIYTDRLEATAKKDDEEEDPLAGSRKRQQPCSSLASRQPVPEGRKEYTHTHIEEKKAKQLSGTPGAECREGEDLAGT